MSASSAMHDLLLVPQANFATTPATPAFKRKKITGTTIGLSKSLIESETINPNRQLEDVRHGTRQVGGEISTELSARGHLDMLEAVLCGTWHARVPNKTATTLSALASDNSINDSANGLPLYEVGESVTITGFTGTPGNNQTGIVESSTVSKLVLTTDNPLVDDAAGESVTLALPLNHLVPGTTRRSFTILRHFTDLDNSADPYHVNRGVQFNTLNIGLTTDALVTATFGIFGRETEFTDALPSGSTITDEPADKPFDSFTGWIKIDGVNVALVTEMSIDLENGIEPRFVLFDDRSIDPKIGKTRVTGQLGLYFKDSTLLAAFNGAEKKQLEFQIEALDGRTLTFLLPGILPTGGQPDVQGDSDITITWPFTATYMAGTATPDALRIVAGE